MEQRWLAAAALWALLVTVAVAQQPAPAPGNPGESGTTESTPVPSQGRARRQLPPSPEASAEPADPEFRAGALLSRAYAFSRELPLDKRANLLGWMLGLAPRIDPEMAKSWADELFLLAQDLSEPGQRGRAQIAAVQALAKIDVDHALEDFRQMGPETLLFDPGLPQDARNYVARSLFPAILRKKGIAALPLLQQEAQRLAEAGTYPYSAMGFTIAQLSRIDRSQAEKAFADAATAYLQSMPTLAGNSDFVDMLRYAWRFGQHPDAQQAVVTAVNNLLARPADAEEEELPEPVEYKGASVDNASDYLLLQLMPAIRQLQPDLLNRIAQSRPALGRAAGAVGAMPQDNGFPGQPGRPASENNPENSLVRRIRDAAASDPQQALAMSNQLQDPSERSQALAVVASGMAGKDPRQAAQLLDDARKAAEKIDDQRKQLQALIAMAAAAERVGNQVVLRDALTRGFAVGNELLRLDQDAHPESPSSFVSLSSLVIAGARSQLELTVAGIDSIQNPQVRAQLLVIAAQNVPRRSAPAKSPAPAGAAAKPAAAASPPAQ